MYENLSAHISERLQFLNGDWVSRNSGYELGLAEALFMTAAQCRYWDATWDDYRLEFKKGRSIWLDLVRYSEVILRYNETACHEVLSLFFIPDKDRLRIVEVICVETTCITEKLRIGEADCSVLLELNQRMPRSLNAQASLTVADLREIACFIVR